MLLLELPRIIPGTYCTVHAEVSAPTPKAWSSLSRFQPTTAGPHGRTLAFVSHRPKLRERGNSASIAHKFC